MIAMDADSGDYGKITYLLDRLSSQVDKIKLHAYIFIIFYNIEIKYF